MPLRIRPLGSLARNGSSVLELERHEDVVDVDAVQQELSSQHAFDHESGRFVQLPRALVRAEHPERQAPCSTVARLSDRRIDESPPHSPPLPRRVDGDPVDLQDVICRRERRDRLSRT